MESSWSLHILESLLRFSRETAEVGKGTLGNDNFFLTGKSLVSHLRDWKG